jgi:hypothetical protein
MAVRATLTDATGRARPDPRAKIVESADDIVEELGWAASGADLSRGALVVGLGEGVLRMDAGSLRPDELAAHRLGPAAPRSCLSSSRGLVRR